MILRCLVIAAIVMGTLAGCATPTQRSVERGIQRGERHAEQQLQRTDERSAGYYVEHDQPWLGDTAVERVASAALPDVFDESVTFRRSYPVDLRAVAEFITTSAGVPTRVTEAAAEPATQGTRQRAGQTGSLPFPEPLPGTFTLHYDGSLRGLLNRVTARTDTAWRYDDGSITIYRYLTRTFDLRLALGDAELDNEIANDMRTSGGSDAESGSSTQIAGGQSAQRKAQLDMWEAVQTSVESMLTDVGTVDVAEPLTQITVTDRPEVVDRIADYIDEVNAKLSRYAAITVDIYAVSLDETEGHGIDWNLVWQDAQSNVQFDVGSQAIDLTNPQGAGFQVVDAAQQYGGTSVMVEALATQGRVVSTRQIPVMTMTNVPSVVQVVTNEAFLERVQTTQTIDVGVQTSLEQGNITTGVTLQLLPVIHGDNSLTLSFGLNIAARGTIQVFESGGNRVQQPTTFNRRVMQTVSLRSDQALVLSGFAERMLRQDRRGIGKPTWWWAGGGVDNEIANTVLVIVIKPTVQAT